LHEPGCSEKKTIAALVPCYHSVYGNATELIYLEQDSVFVPRTVKTVLRNIAKEYAIDLKALRQKYGTLLGCGRASPIPLDRDTIFIPLKMRRIVSKNDSARGYINYLAIMDVKEENPGTCLVVLSSGRKVKCFHSAKNIKQHMLNCHVVRQKLSGLPKAGLQSEDEYLNYPATKSDIAMLLKEIRELREKM
jgi:hypothetical protein